MAMSDDLRRRITEALQAGRSASRADLITNYPMEITLNEDFQAYTNPRVTLAVDGLSPTEVTHLLFTPIPDAGVLAVTAAESDANGAERLSRSPSGRTALVNLRAALNGFHLRIPKGRKLKLKVEEENLGPEQPVLLIRVKRPRTKRVNTRKPKAE
jgi:hypothetical protein